MSQITRCPSCATLFKVVQDQLRISDGWVRCGQCQEVFDATLSLQEAPAAVPPPATDAQAQTKVSVADAITLPTTTAAQSDGVVPAGVPRDAETPGDEQCPVEAGAAEEEQEETAPELPVAQSESEAKPEPDAALVLSPPLSPSPPSPPLPQLEGYELPAALDDADADTDADADRDARQMTDAASAEFPLRPPLMAELQKNIGTPATETVKEQPFTPGFKAESLEQEHTAARSEGLFGNHGAAADTAENAAVDGEAVAPRLFANSAEHAQGAQDATEEAVAGAFATQRLPETPPEALPQELAQPPSATAQDEPSFVRSARLQALWHRPAVRLCLGAAVLLLAAMLLLQIAVQQRHYLASAKPQWRPALQALCVPLQCEVRAYQHIASVVVDGSAFNKLRGNTYRFALTLKNQSAVPVALPAVELTLTDTSDQPVLRRVLTPAELTAPATLPADGEWSTSLEMDVSLAGNGSAQIAGYRVLAFYP